MATAPKRRDYEQAGVLEYLVVLTRQREVRRFVLHEGQFREMPADTDGVIRSKVFPGLWLHTSGLLQLDGLQVIEMLRQGMTTPEYTSFRQQLQGQ